MVGLQVPVIPVEHQYIVTEPHPAILERKAKGLPEMGVLREADSSWYMREEAARPAAGPLRRGSARVLCGRSFARERVRAVPRGSRAA